jgi:hypothetical protein
MPIKTYKRSPLKNWLERVNKLHETPHETPQMTRKRNRQDFREANQADAWHTLEAAPEHSPNS